MRVVGGQYRGRKLKAPKGLKTRPTSDKVKEAIFNTLAPVIPGCDSFLDLFAGSGSVGIEALSRGVNRCVFVEKWPVAIKILKDNIKFIEDREIKIMTTDAFKAVEQLKSENFLFDIIFMDPPYSMKNTQLLLNKVEGLLNNTGIAILETSAKNSKDLPSSLIYLICFKEVTYGGTKLMYFKKK